MRRPLLLAPLLFACTPEDTGDTWSFPAPEAMPELRGPGGPTTTFTEADLFENCAVLEPPTPSVYHHNLVMPYRGHMVLPAAPEFGTLGGMALFDMSDPCNPIKVGEGTDPFMRETHAIGMVHLDEGEHAGDWAVVNLFGGAEGGSPRNSGIQFWDLSDPSNPTAVADLPLPDVWYPDAYAQVSLSVFWQYPYVYVASADVGVQIVDATDPLAPVEVGRYSFDDGLRAGSVFAMGNLLMVTSAEQSQTALLDISTPEAPQPIPGGSFRVQDRDGNDRDYYFGNLAGNLALFARKESGGGPIVYDISDPSNPTFVSDLPLPGGGGYIFYDEGFLFTGDSSAAHIVDARNLDDLTLLGTGELAGDLDTITPYGNVAILSVDDDAEDQAASVVMPWRMSPDTSAPDVLHLWPADGAEGLAITSRFGVGLDEPIEPTSAFEGSVRLYEADTDTPVRGWVSAQEATVNYAPREPLKAGTRYRLEILAGGIADINGNTLDETLTATFTTAQ